MIQNHPQHPSGQYMKESPWRWLMFIYTTIKIALKRAIKIVLPLLMSRTAENHYVVRRITIACSPRLQGWGNMSQSLAKINLVYPTKVDSRQLEWCGRRDRHVGIGCCVITTCLEQSEMDQTPLVITFLLSSQQIYFNIIWWDDGKACQRKMVNRKLTTSATEPDIPSQAATSKIIIINKQIHREQHKVHVTCIPHLLCVNLALHTRTG